MDDSVKKLVELASKRFSLGLFGLGVALINFGIWTNPDDISGMSHGELIMFAWLGAAFALLSAWAWARGNDYLARAAELQARVRQITLDSEIKNKLINLEAERNITTPNP
jgi:hypothetical protein